MRTLYFDVLGLGCTTITVKSGEKESSMNVYVVPKEVNVTDIEQTGYRNITIRWDKAAGCSGYEIQRSLPGESQYVTVKEISGYIVKKSTAKTVVQKKALQERMVCGQYLFNTADSDETFYYNLGGKLYMAVLRK